MNKKRILIFGAGVIGSVYGGRLALSGHHVTLLARGNRLEELLQYGLLIQKTGEPGPIRVPVAIISILQPGDRYDYVFVAVRKDQVTDALPILKNNCSERFVLMVNNCEGYSKWISILDDRIIAGFPGCGGGIEEGIVHYEIISKSTQPTMLGRIGENSITNLHDLKEIIIEAGFPVRISQNIDVWQKSHVAMIAAFSNLIYYDGGTNYTAAKNSQAIRQMTKALKESFKFLNNSGIGILPGKSRVFIYAPLWIMDIVMKKMFNSAWAETVIYNHAHKAKYEMLLITKEFIRMAEEKGYELKELKLLSGFL
jgi:2-dehydropantoate 2-reductase